MLTVMLFGRRKHYETQREHAGEDDADRRVFTYAGTPSHRTHQQGDNDPGRAPRRKRADSPAGKRPPLQAVRSVQGASPMKARPRVMTYAPSTGPHDADEKQRRINARTMKPY